MENKMNTISERIVKLRSNKTQSEFAKELGVEQTHISRYERAEVKPTSEFFTLLINKLNVNVNWLLTGKGKMYQSEMNDSDLAEEIQKLKAEYKAYRDSVEIIAKHINGLADKKPLSKKKQYIPLNKYGMFSISNN